MTATSSTSRPVTPATISNDLDSTNGIAYNQKPSIEQVTPNHYDESDAGDVRMMEIHNEKGGRF